MTTADKVQEIREQLMLRGIIGKEQTLVLDSVAANLEPCHCIMFSDRGVFDTLARGMRNCFFDGVFANTLEKD